LGVFPMDVKRYKISFLCADGHKWLLGPEGAALFYCCADKIRSIKQAYVSWLSVREPFAFDFSSMDLADGARRFECGTPNFAGIAGLHQSLALLIEVGIERITERILTLTRLAEEGLRHKGYDILSPWEEHERSGILTFGHAKHPPKFVAEQLQKKKTISTVRGGGVRISPHFYNNPEEVGIFLDALP